MFAILIVAITITIIITITITIVPTSSAKLLDTGLCAGKKRDSGGVPALYLHLRHKRNSAKRK